MSADLHDAVGVACGFYHRDAFKDRVADRLFDIHVGSGFDGGDHNQGVPMIRRGNDDDLRLLLVEQLTVIAIVLELIAGQLAHLLSGQVELVLIDVAHCDEFALIGAQRFAQDVLSPPAATDECSSVLLATLGS